MKGDFSRLGFSPSGYFSGVLTQQGRMTLDSDSNEQQSINLHAIRALAADLIGRHGGAGDSFKLTTINRGGRKQLMIGPGRYYVDGWMAENFIPVAYMPFAEDDTKFVSQPFFPAATDLKQGSYLAFLELWERAVSAAELDPLGPPTDPRALREVALGGADTSARRQLVWQVRLLPAADLPRGPNGQFDPQDIGLLANRIRHPWCGLMSAEAAKPPVESDNPCDVPPRSRYRGIENQLYRIEIAHGGAAAAQGGATFVWSRENGAVAFPIERVAGTQVKLADVWRDARFGIAVGDIVEVVSDWSGLGDEPSFDLVEDWDPDSATVTLENPPAVQSGGPRRPLLLRRWDHGGRRGKVENAAKPTPQNTLLIEEGKPLAIEEGITIRFVPPTNGQYFYRSGDYWLIPARVALGDILWPRWQDAPASVPPHGIERHVAPLALVDVAGDGQPTVTKDLRNRIDPIAKPV